MYKCFPHVSQRVLDLWETTEQPGWCNPEANEKQSGQAPWCAPDTGGARPPAKAVAASKGADIFSPIFPFLFLSVSVSVSDFRGTEGCKSVNLSALFCSSL